MEEHTRAALLVGEAQISRIHDALAGRSPAQVGGLADDTLLAHICTELPPFDSAWVFDADANLRAGSNPLPPHETNVHDRAYYTALRHGAKSSISPLIWDMTGEDARMVLSRRIESTAGDFAGGIQVSLKASYFVDFYRTLNPAPGAVFAIYKDNGELIMRSSQPRRQDASQKPFNLMDTINHEATGVQIAVSRLDGIRRLYAYRKMDSLPLVVVAGLPLRQVFEEWHERTLRNGVITSLGLTAVLVIAIKLSRTMARETSLRARAEGLLADKQTLFQEIHHRVKNNLQIIASFLTMQAVHSRDPATTEAFEEALSRLQSMGLVHQILYEQNEATEVAMADYLRALAATIGQTFGADERGIRIEVAPTDDRLPIDQAVPLALLANEALTNALKHAFPDHRPGVIRMELRREGPHLIFTLADDGIGMPANAKGGLGMTILSALAGQLGGSLDWSVGPGTRLTLTIPPETNENGGA